MGGGISVVDAWRMPWDYALSMLGARNRRIERARETTGNGGGKVEPLLMTDGTPHARGASQLAAMLGF